MTLNDSLEKDLCCCCCSCDNDVTQGQSKCDCIGGPIDIGRPCTCTEVTISTNIDGQSESIMKCFSLISVQENFPNFVVFEIALNISFLSFANMNLSSLIFSSTVIMLRGFKNHPILYKM